MIVAVRPKTTLMIVWVESDKAEADMLRRQLVWGEGARRGLVWGDGARRGKFRVYEGIESP